MSCGEIDLTSYQNIWILILSFTYAIWRVSFLTKSMEFLSQPSRMRPYVLNGKYVIFKYQCYDYMMHERGYAGVNMTHWQCCKSQKIQKIRVSLMCFWHVHGFVIEWKCLCYIELSLRMQTEISISLGKYGCL